GIHANIALPNTLSAYQAIFEGPTFNPATLEEARSMFRYKADGPLAHLRGAIDYATGDIDETAYPAFLGFTNRTDVPIGVAVLSGWARLHGGGAGQAIIPGPGVRYQISNSADGAGASLLSAEAGLVDEGQFVQVEWAPASTGSTTVAHEISVGGTVLENSTRTASLLSFPTVDNQSAAYSTVGAIPSAPARRKLLLVTRFKFDSVPAVNQSVLNVGNVLGQLGLVSPGGSNIRFQMINSGVIRASSVATPGTGWHEMFVAVDFTQTDPNNVFTWYDNDAPVPLASGAVITTTGSQSFNASDLSGFGVFARANGSEIMDGKIEYVWAHMGDASWAMPDIRDAAVRDRWTADLIGTQGEGPIGAVPSIYFAGAASDWNAPGGLANKGSLVLPLSKQTGAYV
ncbi:MAG: hypothetical protein U1A07_23340, partial [Phenylobacterium sp.]|nr:hypothetical protein [Phenylobacterium sp.]